MFNWVKKGLIFKAINFSDWGEAYATAPTIFCLSGSIHRVLFATRCKKNISRVGYFDIDLSENFKILKTSGSPILVPGPIGGYDGYGIYPSSIIEYNEALYLYTIGWTPGSEPHLFYSSIGLAVSYDGGNTFTKTKATPILTRNEYDPLLVTAPYVYKVGSKLHMHYISGRKWTEIDSKLQSDYLAKIAFSTDGVNWKTNENILFPLASNETNIGRTCVLKHSNRYYCWYSYTENHGNYKIGFAESGDGISFTRKDSLCNLSTSDQPWESQAVCHPAVVKFEGKAYMFYNGNSFGKDGIALAVSDLK